MIKHVTGLTRLGAGAVLALWATVAPARGVDLPDMGDPSGRVLTAEQEQRIGERLMRRLRQELELIQDPWLDDYLNSLGYRLAANSEHPEWPFGFFIVHDSTINAFAAPGGYIGVHSGLILTTESESELAAVLAHEIAHVTQRHLARMYEAAGRHQIATTIAILAALLLGGGNDQVNQAAIATGVAANAQLQINFTRANEEEADRLGMGVLARSGFDPEAMATFFERMQRTSRLYGVRLPEFLSTHPVTVARIADARSRARQLAVEQPRDDLTYYLARARLQVLTAADPQRAVQHFAKELAAEQPTTPEAARYGYAVALLEAGEHGKARAEIERLRAANPERIPYLITAARIEMASGHVDKGAKIFDKGLLIYPHSRPLTHYYARGLIHAGRAEAARELLQDFMRNRKPDATVHALYAKAAGDSGHRAEAYQHQAEYLYLTGQTHAAIEQLTRASELEDLDYYRAAEIAARLQELKRVAAEEESK